MARADTKLTESKKLSPNVEQAINQVGSFGSGKPQNVISVEEVAKSGRNIINDSTPKVDEEHAEFSTMGAAPAAQSVKDRIAQANNAILNGETRGTTSQQSATPTSSVQAPAANVATPVTPKQTNVAPKVERSTPTTSNNAGVSNSTRSVSDVSNAVDNNLKDASTTTTTKETKTAPSPKVEQTVVTEDVQTTPVFSSSRKGKKQSKQAAKKAAKQTATNEAKQTNKQKNQQKKPKERFNKNTPPENIIASSVVDPSTLYSSGIKIKEEAYDAYGNDPKDLTNRIFSGLFNRRRAHSGKTNVVEEIPLTYDENGNILDSWDEQIAKERTSRSKEWKRQVETRKSIQLVHRNPYLLRIEGTTSKYKKNDDGTYTFTMELSPKVQEALSNACEELNLDAMDIFELVLDSGGIGLDTADTKDGIVGTMYGGTRSALDFDIAEYTFIDIIDNVKKSMELYGHPYAFVRATINYRTKCFPVGFISERFAQKLINRAKTSGNPKLSKVASMTAKEMQDAVKKEFVERTRPAILKETAPADNKKQRWALYNLNAALIEEAGEDVSEFGISYFVDAHLDDIWNDMQEARKANHPDLADALEQTYKNEKDFLDDWLKRRYKVNATRDSEGHIIDYNISYRSRQIDKACHAIATWIRYNAIAFNLPLMLSNEIDHAVVSLVNTPFANLLYGAYKKDPRYHVSDKIKNAFTSKEGKDAFAALFIANTEGGPKVLEAFKEYSGLEFNSKNLSKFLKDVDNGLLDGNIDLSEQEKSELKTLANKILKAFYTAGTTGGIFLKGRDISNFIQTLMLNMAIKGNKGEPSFTTKTIEQSIERDGIGATILNLALTPQGYDAFVASTNQSLGRISPLTHIIERFLRNHGVTDFLLSLFGEKFLRYNIAFAERMIPLSNTLSYLAVKAGTKPGDDIRNFQLGSLHMDDKGFKGLRECIAYDIAQFGTQGMVALLFFLIAIAFGVDEPDDSQKRYVPTEWLIAKNSWIPAWWMNDMLGWGFGVGIALAVQSEHPEDPTLFWNLFVNGLAQIADGNIVLDILQLVTHGPESIVEDMQAIKDGDFGAAPSEQAYVSALVEGKVAQAVNNVMPLNGVTGILYRGEESTLFGTEQAQQWVYKIYDTDKYTMEEAKEKNKLKDATYEDSQKRDLSLKYPWLAAWNNLTNTGNIFGDSDKVTGYFSWQQPDRRQKDPVRSDFYDILDFDPDDPEIARAADGGQAAREAAAMDLINLLKEYDNPESFTLDGGFLPAGARINAKKWIYTQIYNARQAAEEAKDYASTTSDQIYDSEEYEYLWSTYQWSNSDLKASLDKVWQASENAWDNYYKIKDSYQKYIDEWINNENIPWTDEGYIVLKSDYGKRYYWINEDGSEGDPANYLDWITHPDTVKREYYRLGNAPSSMLPFTTVRNDNTTGYDFQTKALWYREGYSDTSQTHAQHEGNTISMGNNAGKLVNDVAFGNGNITPHEPEEEVEGYSAPVAGARGLLASEGSMPTDILDYGWEDFLNEYGLEDSSEDSNSDSDSDDDSSNSKSKSKSNPYGVYSGSKSSGGSNYNPKIYAHSTNVSYDRASTMSTARPYKHSTTYIRPVYETKGSRQAYKRSDI